MVAWHQMYQAAHGTDERRPFSRATLARIGRFARPHRRRIVAFVGLSVFGAGLAVATPVLAGRVVDAIVRGGPASLVVGFALAIAGIAVAEAGVGIVQRWLSSTLGEGLILDLRAAVFDHVQRHAGGVLHPHPDRRAGQPPQQRRDRRAAGVLATRSPAWSATSSRWC